MIGGVQAGYNVATAVRPAARRRSRSHVSELPHLEFDRLLAGDAARSDVVEQWTMSERCAAASATPAATGCSMPPAVLPMPASASQHARRSATRRSISTSASAGPPAPAWNMPSRRTGASRLEYLYNQFDHANVRLAVGHAIFVDAGFPVDPRRPQPQDRLAGVAGWHAEDRRDRSRIRPLGNPRPDHLSAAGLSVIPRALYRHQQPDAGAAGAGDLEQQPVSERPALGGRRGLLQSRTAAGIWLERHRRRRRISQRRGAEIQLPLPALQHLAAVRAPDLRIRRRAGGTGQRTDAARGQGRHLPADAAGRQVRGRRCLRRQRLRQGHPQGFHELVDVGARRIRLFRRQGRAHLRRHRRAQSEAMGAARAATS